MAFAQYLNPGVFGQGSCLVGYDPGLGSEHSCVMVLRVRPDGVRIVEQCVTSQSHQLVAWYARELAKVYGLPSSEDA